MPLPDNLLTPIPGDHPGGANLRYDPITEKIKEARREDDVLPAGDWEVEPKVADHKTVIKLGVEAIASKSKDLQIAAWLTESLLKTQGFIGFREGFALVDGLVTKFWDHCFPAVPAEAAPDGENPDEWYEERQSALELRSAPLSWMGGAFEIPLRQAAITKSGLGFLKYKESRTVGYEADASATQDKLDRRNELIGEGKLTAEEWDLAEKATGNEALVQQRAALRATLETLHTLNAFCHEKFGDFAPSFTQLRQTLEELAHFVNGLLKARGYVEEGEVTSTAQATEVPGVQTVTARLTGITPGNVDEVGARLEAIARYLRGQDPQNPAPYTILRGYRWGELRANSGGMPDPLKLEAPSSEARQRVKKMALEGNFQGVIEAGESLMAEPGGRAWLDLQRYVVQACEKLSYRAPAAAIRAELRALLSEFPTMPSWTLMDDSTAASAETKTWLKQVQASKAAASEDGDLIEEQEGDSPIPDAYMMALEAGNIQSAVRILNRDLARQPSGRSRFQRRLQMARICFDQNQPELARLLLGQLAAAIDEHKLENWETGETVAGALALLYQVKTQSGEDDAPLYNRIAMLDPVQALSCKTATNS